MEAKDRNIRQRRGTGKRMMKKITKRVIAFSIAVCMMLPGVVNAEVNNDAVYAIETNEIEGWPQGPEVHAETAVLMDADTGVVLYDKGMNEQRYPASITKIMTALLVLENCELDEQVTFTESGLAHILEGTNIGMQVGEVLSVEQCLYAVMIKSANEVADQLAEYVGGSREAFVEMMNERATALSCTNTSFANPSGLPDENHRSTAYDMALIFQAALQNETFCEIIQTLQYTIEPTNLNAEARTLTSAHALLVPSAPEHYEGSLGGKTGVTIAAKNTLVTGVQRDDTRLIAVVMRAEPGEVCADARALFDYGYDNFERLPVTAGTLLVPHDTQEAEIEKIETRTEKNVAYNYYYNEYPLGVTTMSIAELEEMQKQALEELIQEAEEEQEQQEVEKVSSEVQQQKAERLMKYRIAIGILAGMILIVLILIIVKIKIRSSKRKNRKKKK